MSDERQQQELEEERMMKTLEVLQRVRNSVRYSGYYGPDDVHFATDDDVRFLAAELGLSSEFKEKT